MIIGPNYLDDVDMDGMEIDIGGGFFGNLDDLLNFPDEDVEEGVAEGDIRGFQEEFPIPPDTLENPNSTVPGNINNSSELPTIAREEIDQLEWLSNFVEASLSARDITIANNFNNKDSHHFCSSSPISVLESSSSSSGGKTVMPLEVKTLIPESGRRKRTRTRLMGPPTFNSRKVISLFSSSSSVTELSASDCAPQLENFAESRPSKKLCFWQTKTYYGKNPQKNVQNSAIVKCKPWSKRLNSDAKEKKKRDKKNNMFSPPVCDMVQPDGQTIKKCTHCEMTNTPQWREGPSGPRTLCNACGVRYKKGRLFPEYRPAASPTYNPLLHANKHKKVIEIRVKVGQNIKLVENVGSPMPSQDSQKTAPVENVGSTNPSQEQRNTTRARNVGFPKPSQEPLPETEPEQECEFIYI